MKSLRLGFSSRISPDFWILSGIEGTPEVRGGGCSPIAQHGGVRSPIAQHEAGGRGGRGGGRWGWGPQPPRRRAGSGSLPPGTDSRCVFANWHWERRKERL